DRPRHRPGLGTAGAGRPAGTVFAGRPGCGAGNGQRGGRGADGRRVAAGARACDRTGRGRRFLIRTCRPPPARHVYMRPDNTRWGTRVRVRIRGLPQVSGTTQNPPAYVSCAVADGAAINRVACTAGKSETS